MKYYNGRCFRKLVVGSMTPLVESIVHGGILKPKHSFVPGASNLLRDFVCKILNSTNLYRVKPIGFDELPRPKATIIDRGQKRALLNQDEVVALLERRGFYVEVVDYS
eukprot:Awhi_evm1s9033